MKIGFIGCGNMASAMIGGILRQGIFSKDEIIVSNLTDEGRARSEKTLGVVTTLDNNEIVRSAKTVVLAVKPQFYEEVLTEVHDSLTTEHTIIGIAPGKTLAWLEEKAGLPLKVVRFMPNTPAQVGEGMTAVCANERVSQEELAEILKITDSFGCTEVIPERLMDAAGAVGGCAPAYVFMFIEAMADAAVADGMPRKQAYKFQQFMIGRYGIDKLWSVLLIFFFVIILLANAFYKVSKITYYAIEIMAFVLVVFAIFRVFSKNIEARRAENAKWLKFENSVKGFFKFQNDKFKQRKTHKFVKCKGCKKTLRLPRHKGKINVTCPHCHAQFVVNTGKKATNNQ